MSRRTSRDGMGEFGSMNGVRAPAADDDLETGEVRESEQQQQQQQEEREDLEEGEVYDETEEEDLEKTEQTELEKRGEVHVTEVQELLEPLLTPEEAQHEELAAASMPLLLTEKVVVSVFVVCFVLVEAYFVGRSYRNWIDDNQHYHGDDGGNSMSLNEFAPLGSPLELPLVVHFDGGGGGKDGIAIPEPFEDFLEGSLHSGLDTGRKGMFEGRKGLFEGRKSLFEAVLEQQMSTGRTRLPPTVDTNPQVLVVPPNGGVSAKLEE